MKRVKRYLLVLISIILLSGCAKNNTTMKINKDKSMNLEVQILVIDESKNILSANFDSADIEKRGFKVTTTTKDNYSGYKITKKFDNIDELSKGDSGVVDISKILNVDFDFSKLFSKKTDFFKETYIANFKYNISDYKTKYLTNETEEDEDEEEEKTTTNDTMELTYTLVLPNKTKSNDASNVSDGGKNLVWKLSSNSDSKINYSFAFYNYKHIIIVCGSALLVVVILIVLLVIIKRKKESKGTLIYKEYDPSIESELNSNEIIKDSEPNEVVENNETPSISEEGSVQPSSTVVEQPIINQATSTQEIESIPQETVPNDINNQNKNYF